MFLAPFSPRYRRNAAASSRIDRMVARTIASYDGAFGFLSSRAILRMALWNAGSISSSGSASAVVLPFPTDAARLDNRHPPFGSRTARKPQTTIRDAAWLVKKP